VRSYKIILLFPYQGLYQGLKGGPFKYQGLYLLKKITFCYFLHDRDYIFYWKKLNNANNNNNNNTKKKRR